MTYAEHAVNRLNKLHVVLAGENHSIETWKQTESSIINHHHDAQGIQDAQLASAKEEEKSAACKKVWGSSTTCLTRQTLRGLRCIFSII